MEKIYRNSWNIVVQFFNSNADKGLNSSEIEIRKEKYGENVITISFKRLIRILLKYIFQIWPIIFIIDGAILISAKQYSYGMAFIIITLLGYFTQMLTVLLKAKQLRNVRKYNKQLVTAIRDNKIVNIHASELVVGDIVILRAGNIVPADIRIIECEKLKVKENMITGQNGMVEKYSTKIEEELSDLSSMKNIVFKNSVIVKGDCTGIVVATGMKTQAAELINAMSDIWVKDNDPFKFIKKKFSIHSLIVIAITLVIALTEKMLNGTKFNYENFAKMGILCGTINNAIIIFIVGYFIAKIYMDDENKKVLKINTLKAINSVDTMIMDKCGIISQREMTINYIFTNGIVYYPNDIKHDDNPNMDRMIQCGLLCMANTDPASEAHRDYNGIMERSVARSWEGKFNEFIFKEDFKRKNNIPYDKERQLFTVVYSISDKHRAYTKGIFESVINTCTHVMKDGLEIEITKEQIESIKGKIIEAESKGYNVIAYAYRSFNYEPTLEENIESNMVFVGFIVLQNVLYEGVGDFINSLKLVNVEPKFITGDTKLSTMYWGKEIGVLKNFNQIITGVEIDNMSDEELDRIIPKIKVFCKLSSDNKLRIINSLKRNESNVCFTISDNYDFTPGSKANLNVDTSFSDSELVNAISHMRITDKFMKSILETFHFGMEYCYKVWQSANFIILTMLSLFLNFIFYYGTENSVNYDNIIWISILNCTILVMVILIDRSKEYDEFFEDELKYNSERTIYDIFIQYIKAFILVMVAYSIQYVSKKFIFIDIQPCYLVNLFLMVLVNRYRIRNKKIFSLSNALYITIMIINLAVIVMFGFKQV